MKNAQILKIDGQISRWNLGSPGITEIHDETLAALYFKYFYNIKYHGEVDILEIFRDEIARRETQGPIGSEAGRGSFNFNGLTDQELDLRAQRAKLLIEILLATYNLENRDFFYRHDALEKIIENLSDDEIAELCAICTSPSHIDMSIWKDIWQAGLDRGPAYF